MGKKTFTCFDVFLCEKTFEMAYDLNTLMHSHMSEILFKCTLY